MSASLADFPARRNGPLANLPALRRARAEALRAWLETVAADRRVFLDEGTYWSLRGRGLLRGTVDRALADLAEAGAIGLEPRPACVVAVLVELEADR